MTDTAVKICGLQSVEVLKSMINLPVDYIGFVFAASRRRVSPEQASELAGVLKQWKNGVRPSAAGVFVNPGLGELREVLQSVELDVVQLHGQESPRFCREVKENFPVSVFKAVSVNSGTPELHVAELDRYAGSIDALLLDTHDPVYGGGSGRTFAWETIPAYKVWTERQGIPLFVAGGLNPSNLKELISKYSPDGVDVSSGVESAPGVKDIAMVTAFVERVKHR
ncbi:phosphoribosylanthranilate isomerase [Paenibacillus sp. DMB20]|uniref:phosphoribosylanthranilate isomerase n=1 Tax=Paenibacillus sp. DMB20 TaxID=1642570 RepID=UPI000627E743|nr:phosphoribosylanthranilate isomerase [Paenibacillus sp. DMB20]KKO51994.1 N-(5'-phosphoribosyl)anthranilate isomerase [Paenibacillus sp. DMB20]